MIVLSTEIVNEIREITGGYSWCFVTLSKLITLNVLFITPPSRMGIKYVCVGQITFPVATSAPAASVGSNKPRPQRASGAKNDDGLIFRMVGQYRFEF
jgi:hypothetical protein